MARYSKTAYQEMADVIREVREGIDDEVSNAPQRHVARKVSTKIAYGMVAIFHDDNPRFDTTKFLVACGVDVKGH